MVKDLHRLRCPCCSEQIEFDARTGKARALRVDTGDEDALGKLLDKQKHESTRLGDAFEQAARAQRGQAGKFDDMFADALEEAKQDEDEKPPNPFDLD